MILDPDDCERFFKMYKALTESPGMIYQEDIDRTNEPIEPSWSRRRSGWGRRRTASYCKPQISGTCEDCRSEDE